MQPALLIEVVVARARHEDIGDAQAQAADEEVEERAAERNASFSRTLDGVARERLVRTVVDLPPLRCTRLSGSVLKDWKASLTNSEQNARNNAGLHYGRVRGGIGIE